MECKIQAGRCIHLLFTGHVHKLDIVNAEEKKEVGKCCLGPHRRVVTSEDGHTWNPDDPFVSLSHLTKRFDGWGGEDHCPCYCFFESYDECRRHEMRPYDYV